MLTTSAQLLKAGVELQPYNNKLMPELISERLAVSYKPKTKPRTPTQKSPSQTRTTKRASQNPTHLLSNHRDQQDDQVQQSKAGSVTSSNQHRPPRAQSNSHHAHQVPQEAGTTMMLTTTHSTIDLRPRSKHSL